MTLGLEKGYFTENAGQYSLNGKQSPPTADAAENVSDLNFEASAGDNFNVEDQEDPTENTDNLVDLHPVSKIQYTLPARRDVNARRYPFAEMDDAPPR